MKRGELPVPASTTRGFEVSWESTVDRFAVTEVPVWERAHVHFLRVSWLDPRLKTPVHAHDDDRVSVHLRRELIRLWLIVAVERPQPERARRAAALRGLAQQSHGCPAVEVPRYERCVQVAEASAAWRVAFAVFGMRRILDRYKLVSHSDECQSVKHETLARTNRGAFR